MAKLKEIWGKETIILTTDEEEAKDLEFKKRINNLQIEIARLGKRKGADDPKLLALISERDIHEKKHQKWKQSLAEK